MIFGGFSPRLHRWPHPGLRESRFVITADEGLRGGRKVPLKANVDEALLQSCPDVATVLVVRRTGADVADDGRPGCGL